MFTTKQRALLRASLQLWLMAVKTSPVHPAEVAGCKAEFLLDEVPCPEPNEVEALIQSLETEIVYTTITLAAQAYDVSKMRLRRVMDSLGFKPVPGSKVYAMSEIILGVNLIRERKRDGFFGKRT